MCKHDTWGWGQRDGVNVNYRLFGTVLGCAISVHDFYKVKRSTNVITDEVAFIICLLEMSRCRGFISNVSCSWILLNCSVWPDVNDIVLWGVELRFFWKTGSARLQRLCVPHGPPSPSHEYLCVSWLIDKGCPDALILNDITLRVPTLIWDTGSKP